MFTVTRKLEWDAGHRVLGHEGKCASLHGHRYIAEITVRSKKHLDPVGRVVDFSVIKEKVGKWIDDNWDHQLLLHKDDPLRDRIDFSKNGRDPYVMQNGNPTAENMAVELFYATRHMLDTEDFFLLHVVIWETPNCRAQFPTDPLPKDYLDAIKNYS